MIIRLTWEEFVKIGTIAARVAWKDRGDLSEPKFLKDHGMYDGIGDHYDYPTYVDFEFESKN